MPIIMSLVLLVTAPPVPGPYDTPDRLNTEIRNYEEGLLHYFGQENKWNKANTSELLERLEIARAIRSKKILPLLVKHIGWTNEIYLESVTGNPDPDKMYPVYVALKAYGSDANDVLFGEIKKGGAIRDQGEWQNQAHAIIYFLISQSDIREIGREIAKKRIEHELRNAKHESECLRLRALLESQLLK